MLKAGSTICRNRKAVRKLTNYNRSFFDHMKNSLHILNFLLSINCAAKKLFTTDASMAVVIKNSLVQ